MEAARPQVEPAVDDRLQRIEQAVEAMAVEVERISEGQRFVTRLLSERPAERVGIGSGDGGEGRGWGTEVNGDVRRMSYRPNENSRRGR